MTEAQLIAFRQIADTLAGAPTNWQWIGRHASQRMFGITEARARAYAERHGGEASAMHATDCRCGTCSFSPLYMRR